MTGILVLIGSLRCLKEESSLISVTYDVGTHLNCIIECFHNKTGFSQTSQLLFIFQCNEHVEMNKFCVFLACTWMTIKDSQFYSIDSLSLDVSLE